MGFIKVEGRFLHKKLQASTSKPTEEEPNAEWIPSDMLEIPKTEPAYAQIDYPSPPVTTHHSTNNSSFNPILTHDTLTKIIDSVVNIVKKEPLKVIVNSTLTEMIQSEVFRNIILSIIQSAPFATTSTKSGQFELIINEKYMQKMIAATINISQGKPLSKIVSSIKSKL